MADMFKNQLQELAQRSCFNLPSYACIREGPDHAPRFKASVNFNGEIFESPTYCTTLKQAENTAAQAALDILSSRGPSRSLTARVLDETGIYKNLLQETAHRAGLNLPVYTTVRSGPGHVPTFTCTVELAGMNFTGEPAKTKKQAEKNAAIAAWSVLKRMPNLGSLTNKVVEEQDQVVMAKVLSNFRSKDDYYRRARKRDHGQSRRRMARGYKDNNIISSSPSSSSNNYLHNHQQCKLLDLLLDSALDSSNSIQKHSSFVSLLPPPPQPRSTSKILPPTSTIDPSRRPIHQIQVNGKQQVIQIPVEEHQKDEEEWLGVGATKKPIHEKDSSSSIYRPFPPSTHISSRNFGSLMASSTSLRIDMASPPLYHPHRIAPAVQIRSVIPVCAAPPAVRPPSTSSSLNSASTTTAKLAQTGAEVSSSIVNKTESSPPTPNQLNSDEFNKKLQL